MHRTALARTSLSAPTVYLRDTGRLNGRILDFGCGRGYDADAIGAEKYDPDGFPDLPEGPFNTIICNYVLNVIPSAIERLAVLTTIQRLLAPGGIAYITVRNDKRSLNGWTTAGTWQGMIDLNLRTIRKCGWYKMYALTRLENLHEVTR